jgi:hypothetical protein
MLKKIIFLLTAIMALNLVVIAQEGQTTTLEGYIADKACAGPKGHVGKESDPQAAAATHSQGCILSDACLKSGLGIYSGGKLTEFDEKSAAQAKAALEKSKKDKGAKFKVTGKLTGGKLTIDKIEEVL